MKTLFAIAAFGVAVALSGAPAFADHQTTAVEADDALNWAAVGGRGALHGAHAEFRANRVRHGRYGGAFDMVYPPASSGGLRFRYGAGRAPYASEGGPALDFQLQGR